MQTVGSGWMWLGFLLMTAAVLIVDFCVLGGAKSHKVTFRNAIFWSLIWMSCALLFDVVIWAHLHMTLGPVIANQKALEFLTGYFIEQTLSIDNLFVFILIFNYFAVDAHYQRRVLLYGVLGAMIMRLIMIFAGTWLVTQFNWLLYVFGMFLVITGVKMLFAEETEKDLKKNILLKFLRKHLRVTDTFHKEKFFIKKDLIWYATPLFLVLILIEASDLIFAFDSIPAIFSVTSDPFIIFTSNIFAIMGLRSLYFALVYMADRFYLLKYGIAVVLTFVGIKMVIAPWIHISIVLALAIVVTILGTTVLLSLLSRQKR
jgi:tellurite resistance protein TerC